jgi:hypothetical protein
MKRAIMADENALVSLVFFIASQKKATHIKDIQ